MSAPNLHRLAKCQDSDKYTTIAKEVLSNEDGIVKGNFIYKDKTSESKFFVEFTANTRGVFNTTDGAGEKVSTACTLWHFSEPKEVE